MSIGIGVDYAVHILRHALAPGGGGLEAALTVTAPAILLAGASTVLGFGSLVFSSYAPLRTLGLVTALTVVTCLATSLLVLPAILGDRR
jgi:predicted RND superfamily exporter protein